MQEEYMNEVDWKEEEYKGAAMSLVFLIVIGVTVFALGFGALIFLAYKFWKLL